MAEAKTLPFYKFALISLNINKRQIKPGEMKSPTGTEEASAPTGSYNRS
jgi:hypothetical protein